MTHTNEAGKLWRRLRRQGFTVERTNNGHMCITRSDMCCMVFAPTTPSDYHSLKNVKAKVKRATRTKDTLT